MNYFIKNIHINKLHHLSGFEIPIPSNKNPHLIITGKNGSGKTILLDAISDFLNTIKADKYFNFTKYDENLRIFTEAYKLAKTEQDKIKNERLIKDIKQQKENLFGKVDLSFKNLAEIVNKYQDGNFLMAYYRARRNSKMDEPKNPTKPVIKKIQNIKETSTSQFLNFLSDLKIQEALARNEHMDTDAEEIHKWFNNFEELLQKIFQDDKLHLDFFYRDYSFKINCNNKSFKFTELSDGFSAIIDIIADLILKMQKDDKLVSVYKKEGIVLIDEIETHLHLELQKIIMPLLTGLFPNVQFIVTTHSPFVLSSMSNAIAYDLEHREILDDLTQYSYESLAEGYFNVRSQSNSIIMKLEKFKELLLKSSLSESEKKRLNSLRLDFEKLNAIVSPDVVGEYRQLCIKYADNLKTL